jgi:hypothetical protein
LLAMVPSEVTVLQRPTLHPTTGRQQAALFKFLLTYSPLVFSMEALLQTT